MKKYIRFAFLFSVSLSYAAATPTVTSTAVLDANNVMTITHKLTNGTSPITVTTKFEDYLDYPGSVLPMSDNCTYSRSLGIVTQTCQLNPQNGYDIQYVSYYTPYKQPSNGIELGFNILFEAPIGVALSPNYTYIPLPSRT